jgi:hypothetical protein
MGGQEYSLSQKKSNSSSICVHGARVYFRVVLAAEAGSLSFVGTAFSKSVETRCSWEPWLLTFWAVFLTLGGNDKTYACCAVMQPLLQGQQTLLILVSRETRKGREKTSRPDDSGVLVVRD